MNGSVSSPKTGYAPLHKEGWVGRLLCIRESLDIPTKIILGVIPIVLILVAWQILTTGQVENRFISPLILPSPLEMILAIKSLWFEAELSRSVLASALRVMSGFAVAIAVVLPLGILMGSFSKVKALFNPLTIFGAYLPIPTLVPLSMILFKTGETQKVMFLALAFAVFLLPMFVKAIDEVDDIYLQTAQTLGASKWQQVHRVLVGVSMANLFDAMRQGFGIGWTYIILAEMVALDRGLGQIIIIAQRRGPREHIYLVLVVIVLIAFITDQAWVKLGRTLFPYRRTR